MTMVSSLRRGLLARVFVHGVALVGVSTVSAVLVVLAIVAPVFARSTIEIGRGLAPSVCASLERGDMKPGPPATLYEAGGRMTATTAAPAFAPISAREMADLQREGFVALHGPAVAAFPCPSLERYVILGHPAGVVPLLPIAAASLVVLLVVSFGSFPLARSLVAPVEELVEATRRVGRGDLETRVASRRHDELGDLARAFDDMTERLRGLIAAEKELLANVSHELRTPLSRIRVVLETAEENPARAQLLLHQIGIDLTDLERLVEDVMDAMRLDVGINALGHAQLPVRLEPTSLAHLVEDAVLRYRAMHPDRRFDVDLGAGHDSGLHADPRLLGRVVDNLLQNALKYSSTETPVEVRVSGYGDRVELAVVDRGIGIDAADLPNVFRPFFRGDKSRTRGTGGAGLGLALARRICEVHHGRIDAESTLGSGTTMRVRLPRGPRVPTGEQGRG